MQNPWYCDEFKPYTPERAKAVRSSVDACARLRSNLLRAAASMTYLYHREQVMVQLAPTLRNFSGDQRPGFLSSHMPWLRDLQNLAVDPTLNITKSAVDAVSSAMLVDNPLIEIRPEGASFEEVLEWEQREMALNSTMNRREARRTHRKIGRDGLVTGEGHVFPCYRNGDLVYRRLRAEQVLYDPFDAEFDDPTYVHMVDLVDRREFVTFIERLRVPGPDGVAKIPDLSAKVKAINAAPTQQSLLPDYVNDYRPLYEWLYNNDTAATDTDRVRVVHSWRRSSSAGATDGRYVITLIDGQDPTVLFDAPFSRVTLPVVSWSPFPSEGSMGGSGLVALLMGWQSFIDRTIDKIIGYQDAYGYLKLIVHKNEFRESEIAGMLKRGIDVIPVNNPGTKPEFVRAQVLSGEDVQVLQMAMDMSRSEYGINRMLTQGTSQLKGQVSGAAIVEEDAKTRDRLSDIREEWSDFRVRLAGATLSAIDDAVAYDPEFRAHYRTPDGETITTTWSELSRVNGRYVLEPEEVGVLGATRAGRMAKLLDFSAKGMVTASQLQAELMRSPDLLKLSRRQTAANRLLERHMRDLTRHPEDPPVPSADLDLEAALVMVTQTLQYAMSGNATDPVLMAMRTYKMGVEGLLAAKMPEPSPTGATKGAEGVVSPGVELPPI